MDDHVPSNPASSPNSESRPLGSPLPRSKLRTSELRRLPVLLFRTPSSCRGSSVITRLSRLWSTWVEASVGFPLRSLQRDRLRSRLWTWSRLATAYQLRILVSPFCSQVLASKCRATLDAAIDSIYLRLDLHQAILDRYWSMDTSLAQQGARNYQLDENLQGLCTYASPFVEYVQARYARLRVQYDKKFKKYDSFREALAERVDQNALI